MKTANLDRIVSRIFLWGLPLVVVVAIGNSFINEDAIANQPPIVQTLHGLAGLVFGLWMAFALYLSARLVFSSDIRTEILPKLVSFKERDEREALLTGNATKKTFLTTLAILILLLCLSVFQVSFYQGPPEKAVNGKNKTITLGLGLGLMDDAVKSQKPVPSDVRKVFINYAGLPFSKTAVILFLIVWQVVSYNYSMRRLLQTGGKPE
jgi:hypothetical protein